MTQAARVTWNVVGALLFMGLGAVGVHVLTLGWGEVVSLYDKARPVWTVDRVEVTGRGPDWVTFTIRGTKHRDCERVRVLTLVHYDDSGGSTEASVRRKDGLPVGSVSFPVGRHTFPEMLATNVPRGASDLVVMSEHECGGRRVRSLLGRVPLK